MPMKNHHDRTKERTSWHQLPATRISLMHPPLHYINYSPQFSNDLPQDWSEKHVLVAIEGRERRWDNGRCEEVEVELGHHSAVVDLETRKERRRCHCCVLGKWREHCFEALAGSDRVNLAKCDKIENTHFLNISIQTRQTHPGIPSQTVKTWFHLSWLTSEME